MLYLYDKALESKFKRVFKNTVFAPVDKFYERYLVKNGNRLVEHPALSLWRLPSEFEPSSARSQLGTSNFSIRNDKAFMVRNIYSMKVAMNYQLDIWASSDIERDDFMKEILFFLTTYPNIVIQYQGQDFEFPVLIGVPDDITNIADFDSTGDIYRVSVPLTVPDARLLFYQDSKICKYIDLTYEVNEDTDSESHIGIDKE